MNKQITPWWARENFWRKAAVWVTAIMLVILIFLTFDSITAITAGSDRVPAYTVINKRIYYRFDEEKNWKVPVIGENAPLFGVIHTVEEAEALVRKGKLVIQSRNCMNCHTLLGNGAYYAPDLTKAWLDPGWGVEAAREQLMLAFLMDPVANGRGYGTRRRMPDLNLSEAEARAIIAYLKWMSSIDTNGFPFGFTPIRQEGDR
jgi:nitric oxide reductase subunit C